MTQAAFYTTLQFIQHHVPVEINISIGQPVLTVPQQQPLQIVDLPHLHMPSEHTLYYERENTYWRQLREDWMRLREDWIVPPSRFITKTENEVVHNWKEEGF